MSYFEMAIIAFILAGIAVAVWKGGQANPESTGKLARRMARVELELKEKATVGDVAALGTEIAELKSEMAGDRRVNQLTYESVKRLEGYFIQKGTEAK